MVDQWQDVTSLVSFNFGLKLGIIDILNASDKDSVNDMQLCTSKRLIVTATGCDQFLLHGYSLPPSTIRAFYSTVGYRRIK